MTYVYDASYIMALIIPDENNPTIDIVHDALDETDEIFVPQLLWYEIANILKNLIRRRRFTSEEVSYFFPMFSFVNFSTDFEAGIIYSKKLWDLCNSYNLSAYDAAYLELAHRKKAILCTLDENLQNAAKKHGVKIIE